MKANQKNEEKELNKIVNSLFGFSKKILISPRIPLKRIQRILQKELNNNPLLFFLSGFKIRCNSLNTIIFPTYVYSRKTGIKLLKSCEKRAKGLLKKVENDSNYLKVLKVHDLLVRNVNYSNEERRELHTIIGPLLNKQGVCDGFAKTFKYLMDLLDIPCMIVNGIGLNQVTGNNEKHSWNMVCIDNNWIHIDVTFDRTIFSENLIRHDYFGLSTSQILRDHQFDLRNYPISEDSSYNYYFQKNLVFTTKKEMRDFFLNEIKNGERNFIFKVPDYSIKENLDLIVFEQVEELLKQNNISAQCNFNNNLLQGVFQIDFKELDFH